MYVPGKGEGDRNGMIDTLTMGITSPIMESLDAVFGYLKRGCVVAAEVGIDDVLDGRHVCASALGVSGVLRMSTIVTIRKM
jgi:hypothetical protein